MTDLPVVTVWHYNGSEWAADGDIPGATTLSIERQDVEKGTWSLNAPIGAAHVSEVDETSLITVDWDDMRWGTGQTAQPHPVVIDDKGEATAQLSGDTGIALLEGVICLPDPTDDSITSGDFSAQPTGTTYSGPAEDVICDLVADHLRDRYGYPITVPTSSGRGATVKIRVHYSDLAKHVSDAAAAGGLVVDVGLVNTTGSRADLTLIISEPADVHLEAILSQELGSLRGADYSTTRPTLTKAVVLGGGTGATRVIRVVTTAASIALATKWGRHAEATIDGQGSFDNATLDSIGKQAIDQATVDDAFAATAAMAPGMKIWERANVGDTIAIQIVGVEFAQVLHGLRLELDKGVTITPLVGDTDGDIPQRAIMRAINGLSARVRNIEVTREVP